MKKTLLLFSILGIFMPNLFAQNNLPYPIIFVHGLTGSDQTFQTTFEYMRDHYNLGAVNVYDVVLNADDDDDEALMSTDVKWYDFSFGGRDINVGRRNFAEDMDDYVDGWNSGTNLFAINFKEERIRGAAGFWNDYFDYSDQAAIYKQGYALKQMIREVLEYTGSEKVILVGHSMGGLCIREYLQRTNDAGVHVNWIDPYSADGHKVARVVTYGTPHLGSNSGFDPTKTNYDDKSAVPDQNTEASRDLKYEYDEYTNCDGYPQGIYLFGGNEYCIKGSWWNPTFTNVDINCDGDEYDDIVGVCEGTKDNPYMPLPRNIRYTWNTSIYDTLFGLVGDGAVAIDRQWLYTGSTAEPAGVADTLLSFILHTSEGSDYQQIIRGLDEPERFDLAYVLQFNRTVLGFITLRSNLNPDDNDVFKIRCAGYHLVGVTLEQTAYTGVDKIGFYDAQGNLLTEKNVNSLTTDLSVNVPDGATEIYVKVHGNATKTSWDYPYKITIWSGSWTGLVSSDWNDVSNWYKCVPVKEDDVYIPSTAPNMPDLNIDVNVNSIEIDNGAKITVEPDHYLQVNGTLKLNGDIILNSDGTKSASLLDNGSITGTGKVTINRYLLPGGYHFLAPHGYDVSTDIFIDITGPYDNPNIYYYDETNDNPDWLKGWNFATGNMQLGTGYAYFTSNIQTDFSVPAAPFTGNLDIPVTNSNYGISSDGWNLVGNPYPSGLDAIAFINGNSSGTILGTVYLWDDDYIDETLFVGYDAWNLSGYVSGSGERKIFNGIIAPGQGFFVNALTDGNVHFDNSMRTGASSIFYKTENNEKIYLTLSDNNNSRNILIALDNNATDGFDVLYDAYQITADNDLLFYSLLDDKEMIIQALKNYGSKIIPLGIKAGNDGKFTFKLDETNFDGNIYLIDYETNTQTDLTKNSYTVNLNQGTINNRFALAVSKTPLSIFDFIDDGIRIYEHNDIVTIESPENNTSVQIYDVTGKKIMDFKFSGNKKELDLNNFTSGIYIVKAKSDNFASTEKISIK